jgi:K+-transporting ATPase ATPase C chain
MENDKEPALIRGNEGLSPAPVGKAKKKRFALWRAALVSFGLLTVLCGVIYPLTVTILAETSFPYESNGSVITVTLKDGSQAVYGSVLIGQEYEDPTHMLGRVNTGISNLAVESDEYKALIADRKAKLEAAGFLDPIPSELLTASGSGVDPHISPDTAYYQVSYIVKARGQDGDAANDLTTGALDGLIDKYTEGRFLWIFGQPTVNVLLVNLALDGLL